VKAAEEKLTDLIGRRKKVENNVKNIIEGVKSLNPEINIIDECMEMKSVMNLIAPDLPLPKQPPQTSNSQPSSASSSSNHTNHAQQNIPKPVPVRATLQNTAHVPPPPTSQQSQQQAQQAAAHVEQENIPQLVIQPKGNEEDPAKRMVTIRRVNLPHAEPQVTVTAKGTTPDKDQLLYTFVNGQLVPASSLHPTAFQNSNGSLQLYMSNNDSDGNDKVTIVEHKQQQVQENTKLNGKHNNNKQNDNKGKKQANEKVIEKSNKKSEKVDKKKEPAQSQPPTPQIAVTTSNSQTSIKKTSKDSKNAKKKQESVKKEDDNSKLTQVDDQQVRKKTRKVYIDPEFAANPFKLLLDDDDEEEEFTTETDEEEESNRGDEEENSIIEKMSNMDISSKNNKKSKEEPKNVKKQAQNQQQSSSSQQQNVKNDKNVQKKQQAQHLVNQKGKIIERQDSVTSATSSNNSKDSKLQNNNKNNNNKKQKNVNEPPKSFVQSFPLHPQYQPTVYKPTDYVKKPTISAQPSHQSSNSIMDQLNRGVRVEGLRLPPGITLTKVAPTNEAISTKRDSINRVSNLKSIPPSVTTSL
jgi:hypothetical protein